jgi:uncharacterized protein
MNADERQLITQLFERMRSFGTPEKDREAEALINQLLRANPDAAYMLVQSVLVQEQALEAANMRVRDLEEQLRNMEEGDRPRSTRSGGFLGGYWGRSAEEPRSSVPQVGARATPSAYAGREEGRSPWQSPPPPQAPPAQPAASGGGFMRSALATAAGVAGGVLVADSIRNMLGGGAHAGPRHDDGTYVEGDKYVDERDNDPGTEEAAYEDDGNDPGFDTGGDGGEIDV